MNICGIKVFGYRASQDYFATTGVGLALEVDNQSMLRIVNSWGNVYKKNGADPWALEYTGIDWIDFDQGDTPYRKELTHLTSGKLQKYQSASIGWQDVSIYSITKARVAGDKIWVIETNKKVCSYSLSMVKIKDYNVEAVDIGAQKLQK